MRTTVITAVITASEYEVVTAVSTTANRQPTKLHEFHPGPVDHVRTDARFPGCCGKSGKHADPPPSRSRRRNTAAWQTRRPPIQRLCPVCPPGTITRVGNRREDMEQASWVPSSVDLDRPSAARMYDYYLGGSHNFAVDREAAQSVEQIFPGMAGAARANRSFLRRAVRYLLAQGIDQFLDLGSGIPTVGNVHEIAQQSTANAKVVYVDVEPVAVAHSTALLADNPDATAIQADVRDPDSVLDNDKVRAMLDFTRPIGLLMVAVLHFVPDADNPEKAVARYRAALPRGSYLAISHGSLEGIHADGLGDSERIKAIYRRTDSPLAFRSREEVAAFFTDLDVVPPGVVPLSEWHADSADAYISAYVGVGRKP
ncbi:SAM-dependent methyltransferase [Actinosynnema sp. NPDC023587]|uniref:SAM-dependent methyltransferase n=1 Tax=Actinosynnema sp. NPDC023587 TaxID=3154695 RepID=UPI0034023677